MRWGWARDFAASGNLINARVEDMASKRTFAEAVQRRRCLLPATSWFEWQANQAAPNGWRSQNPAPTNFRIIQQRRRPWSPGCSAPLAR